MAFRKAAMLLISALCVLPAIVQGYSIDSSCDSIKNVLKDKVAEAMEIVDTAKEAVQRSPMDDEVDRLAKMLFAEKDIPNTLEDIFMGMGQQKDLKPVGAEPNIYPTIYCNLDRFQRKKKTLTLHGMVTQVYDSVNDVTFPEGSDSEYERCRSGTVMAFTTTFGNPTHRHSIQLCPWYLTVAGYTDFSKDVEDKLLAKLNKGKLPGKLPDSTPIDSFQFFLHVLIHEFSHTTPAKKLSTNKPATDLDYEWKKCLKLGAGQGCDNADSIAFFARGADLIVKHNIRITEDGELEAIK